ncbi:MAG: hypothetical protein CFE45_28905 [Burkholderiales bacterium PBB5]|nr:MAG: hypothetical protein CFE45_28905 [Burkholderiales bacterium PBB5]
MAGQAGGQRAFGRAGKLPALRQLDEHKAGGRVHEHGVVGGGGRGGAHRGGGGRRGGLHAGRAGDEQGGGGGGGADGSEGGAGGGDGTHGDLLWKPGGFRCGGWPR